VPAGVRADFNLWFPLNNLSLLRLNDADLFVWVAFSRAAWKCYPKVFDQGQCHCCKKKEIPFPLKTLYLVSIYQMAAWHCYQICMVKVNVNFAKIKKVQA